MSNKQNKQPTSTSGIMEKLYKILQTTHEILILLKSFEKESKT